MAAETMAEAVMHRLQRGALQQLAQLVVNISKLHDQPAGAAVWFEPGRQIGKNGHEALLTGLGNRPHHHNVVCLYLFPPRRPTSA